MKVDPDGPLGGDDFHRSITYSIIRIRNRLADIYEEGWKRFSAGDDPLSSDEMLEMAEEAEELEDELRRLTNYSKNMWGE